MVQTLVSEPVKARTEAIESRSEPTKTKAFNSFQIAQAQFDKVAEYLGLDPATRDLLRYPLREYHFAIPVRMDDGSTQDLSRLPGPAQRCPWPGKGRHPLPSAGDGGHGARAGDVDDMEVRSGRYSAGRSKGRSHLRSAQPERPRAGADMPRLGATGSEERRSDYGRSCPRCHD